MNTPDTWVFPHAAPLPKGQRTFIMGIINMTPDSFSGRNSSPTSAAARALALEMLANGADIIDIGAESSRPGAETITAEEEISRLGNVVRELRQETASPISVDTYHPETARHVLAQGADIINDITALRSGWGAPDRHHSEMAKIIAGHAAHVILMHMPNSPGTMQNEPEYFDIVPEVREFLLNQAELAERNGIERDRIWLDPGFGFGKTFHHNRELLIRLPVLADTGFPVAVGLSRKRMIDEILHLPPDERLEGSLALAVIASFTGADLIRTHDPKPTARAIAVADAIRGEESP